MELEEDSENENAIVHLLRVAVAIAGALLKPSNRVHRTRVQVLDYRSCTPKFQSLTFQFTAGGVRGRNRLRAVDRAAEERSRCFVGAMIRHQITVVALAEAFLVE